VVDVIASWGPVAAPGPLGSASSLEAARSVVSAAGLVGLAAGLRLGGGPGCPGAADGSLGVVAERRRVREVGHQSAGAAAGEDEALEARSADAVGTGTDSSPYLQNSGEGPGLTFGRQARLRVWQGQEEFAVDANTTCLRWSQGHQSEPILAWEWHQAQRY